MLGLAWLGVPAPAHAGSVITVSPSQSLSAALKSARPGDTLQLRGGTWTENVSAVVTPGTSSSPVKVMAYPGETPVIKGLLWISKASYWTLDGLHVEWNTSNSSSKHMVKMTDGTGWRITNADFGGARSYAALLIAGKPSSWRVDSSYIHDTAKSNGTNQDHLIYVNGSTGGGIIERNILARSPNGRGVKIGPPSSSSSGIGNVQVRYNTFVDNLGSSNVGLSYGAVNNAITRNLMVGASSYNIDVFNLNGTGNTSSDNFGWGSGSVVNTSDSGLRSLGGEVHSDPQLDSSYRPHSSSASAYGRYAP